MKSFWTRPNALKWTVKDPLAEQCANASMDWIDEQLRTNRIDHVRMHARITNLLSEHLAATARGSRILRPQFAGAEHRVVVGKSGAHWLQVAAGVLIAIMLTTITTSHGRKVTRGKNESERLTLAPLSIHVRKGTSDDIFADDVDNNPFIGELHTEVSTPMTPVRPPKTNPPLQTSLGSRRALSAPTNDWAKYCASLSMSGVSQGEQILASSSVPAMQLLWSRSLNGPIASAPSVVQGKVYVGDWGGYEWSLDASTGDVIAFVNLGLTKSEHCNPDSLGISSSPLVQGGSVFLAGGDDAFYSLDADTLQVKWRRSLGDNSSAGGYYGWCSPSMAGGKVLQGIASNCDDPFPRGAIAALDPATGEALQMTYFVPEDHVGAGVWASPAVDTDHNKVFVTTGSSHSFADGDAFSIVRLDLDTMLIEDRWKLPATSDRTWDIDWGSSPVLFTDAAGRELVGAGQKDGGFYAFDRNDLAAGPIWTAPIAIGGEVPQIGQATLSTPAFDGKVLYVGGGRPRDTEDPSVLGAVSAIDPADGKILWRHTFAGPVIAPVSYANGVVFAIGGKSVAALDAMTGSLLWSNQMKASGVGGIVIARGRAYVGDLSGTIYAFGLSSTKVVRIEEVPQPHGVRVVFAGSANGHPRTSGDAPDACNVLKLRTAADVQGPGL